MKHGKGKMGYVYNVMCGLMLLSGTGAAHAYATSCPMATPGAEQWQNVALPPG